MTGSSGDTGDTAGARTLQDPLAEALRIVDLADQRGLLVRLMGGMAIRAHAPDWPHGPDGSRSTSTSRRAARTAGRSTSCSRPRATPPDKRHNALFGEQAGVLRRRRPQPPGRRARGQASRCAIASSSATGSRRRARRCRSPSSCCPSSRSSRSTARTCSTPSSCSPSTRSDRTTAPRDSRHGLGTINVPRILSFTSNDWGWWRTVTGNLDTLEQYLATELTPEDLDLNNGRPLLFDPAAQIAALRTAIDDAPKSTRWKLRARVGERQTVVPGARRDGARG